MKNSLSSHIAFFAVFAIITALPCTPFLSAKPIAHMHIYENEIQALKQEITQRPQDLELKFRLGYIYNEMALAGNLHYIDPTIEIFDEIHQQDSSRYDALAFYGSASTLKAKHIGLLSKKKWALTGLHAIDKAYREDPENVRVRMVRGANGYLTPKILDRHHFPDIDFPWLLEKVSEHPENIDAYILQAIFFHIGNYRFLNQDPTCIQFLKDALSMDSGISIVNDKIYTTLQTALKKFSSQH